MGAFTHSRGRALRRKLHWDQISYNKSGMTEHGTNALIVNVCNDG